jgi:hypothetical protein
MSGGRICTLVRCLTRVCGCACAVRGLYQVGRVQSDLGRHLQLLRFFGRGLPRSQQRDDRVQPHRWRGHQDRQDDPLQQPHRRTCPSPPVVCPVYAVRVVSFFCTRALTLDPLQGFSPTQLRLTLSMDAPELSQPFSISYPLSTLFVVLRQLTVC